MLSDFTAWVLLLITGLFSAVWDFIADVLLFFLQMILTGLGNVLALLPSCGCFTGGLQLLYTQLDPGIAYITNQVGVPGALLGIGAAFVFRMSRKLITLFQW
jgi:hypothetical protein